MNKLILIILIVGMAIMPFFSFAENETELYAKSGRVIEVDTEHDSVTFVDSVGFEWTFIGAEDWMVGDWCAVIFDTMGTDIIFDDEIVSIRYENW